MTIVYGSYILETDTCEFPEMLGIIMLIMWPPEEGTPFFKLPHMPVPCSCALEICFANLFRPRKVLTSEG